MIFHFPKPFLPVHWNVIFLFPVFLLLTVIVAFWPFRGFAGSLLIFFAFFLLAVSLLSPAFFAGGVSASASRSFSVFVWHFKSLLFYTIVFLVLCFCFSNEFFGVVLCGIAIVVVLVCCWLVSCFFGLLRWLR